ncbi:MAG: trypsin-like peptidase domain-containing protein, partial [Paracoccaceae bacterium]
LSEYSAKVVGIDKNIDIALLKIETDEPLPFVKFGDSDLARVGDWVMAIGNPLGQGFSVSAGIISARNRTLSGSYDDYIQTDAAINRGNSGGPLFNMDGEVIGVNTAILSPTGGSIGIGFSMSSNVVGPVVAQLKEFGEVRRGWLGVTIGPVTEEIAQTLGIDEAAGAIISEISSGGPADAAGIEVADVIILFDGKDVADAGELVRLVGKAPVGSTVKVVVLRNGRRKTLDVVLGQRPENITSLPQEQPAPAPEGVVGLMLLEIDDALREEKSLPETAKGLLVVGVDESSDAYAKDIREGDIITDAGQETVETVEAFKARLEATKEAGRSTILLLVRRDGQPRFVVVEIK